MYIIIHGTEGFVGRERENSPDCMEIRAAKRQKAWDGIRLLSAF